MGKVFGKDGTPRGVGNQVSAEFNLVYRWHSAISEKDEKWTENVYREIFGKESHEVSMQEHLAGLGRRSSQPGRFPSPDEVRIDRPLESYIHYGEGPHACLGKDASRVSITAVMKVVGRLDNLRRAPGPQGQLKKIPRPGGFYIYMRPDHGPAFTVSLVGHADGRPNILTLNPSDETQEDVKGDTRIMA